MPRIPAKLKYPFQVIFPILCVAITLQAQPPAKAAQPPLVAGTLPKICGTDRNEQCKADGGLNETLGDPQLATHPTVGIPEGEAINAEPIGRHLLVPSAAWDVPAVQYETPASYPSNVSAGGNGFATDAVCITAPETHWKCNDSARILLTSQDGVRHCILFPPQQPEVISITEGTSATDCPTSVPGETSSYGDYSNNGVCISNGANWIPLTSGVKPVPKVKVPTPRVRKAPSVPIQKAPKPAQWLGN